MDPRFYFNINVENLETGIPLLAGSFGENVPGIELLITGKFISGFSFSESALENEAARLSIFRGKITSHLPFMNLDISQKGTDLTKRSLDTLEKSLRYATAVGASSAVLHLTGTSRFVNRETRMDDRWFSDTLHGLGQLLESCSDCRIRILLENIYDTEPCLLESMRQEAGDPRLGFCFDTGHFNIFSRITLSDWLATWNPHIVQFHVHDNAGKDDSHSVPFTGSFPFDELLKSVRQDRFVFEMKNRDDICSTMALVLSGRFDRSM